MRSAANVVRLPSKVPVKIDDGPRTIALVQQEIFRSGWSYQRLADAAGVHTTTIGAIATGSTSRPQLRTIILILAALGWSVYASENS